MTKLKIAFYPLMDIPELNQQQYFASIKYKNKTKLYFDFGLEIDKAKEYFVNTDLILEKFSFPSFNLTKTSKNISEINFNSKKSNGSIYWENGIFKPFEFSVEILNFLSEDGVFNYKNLKIKVEEQYQTCEFCGTGYVSKFSLFYLDKLIFETKHNNEEEENNCSFLILDNKIENPSFLNRNIIYKTISILLFEFVMNYFSDMIEINYETDFNDKKIYFKGQNLLNIFLKKNKIKEFDFRFFQFLLNRKKEKYKKNLHQEILEFKKNISEQGYKYEHRKIKDFNEDCCIYNGKTKIYQKACEIAIDLFKKNKDNTVIIFNRQMIKVKKDNNKIYFSDFNDNNFNFFKFDEDFDTIEIIKNISYVLSKRYNHNFNPEVYKNE